MRTIVCRCVVGLCVLAVSASAWAANHLWHIHEVYSTPDGSLQYVEMFNGSNGEHFLEATELIAASGGLTRTFTFPANLPTSSTANHHLLIASPNFEEATGVAPDYTFELPFLFLNNGSVEFTASGAIVEWTGNPFTGAVSVDENGDLIPPTPTNFAGESGTVPEPAMGGTLGLAIIAMTRRRARAKQQSA